MPIYTYACNACGAQLERRQSFSDAPLSTCEACGGSLRRVLHPVGVIFKGSGFYNTDYKKSTNGSTTSSDGSAETPKEAGSDTSKAPESKPSEPVKASTAASSPGSDSAPAKS